MARKIKRLNYIRRQLVREKSDCIFLYGDNLEGWGKGGQAAEMRGEPNAIGIPTKKKPAMSHDAYFTDAEFEANKVKIDEAMDSIPDGVTVYIPTAGIGTGLSMLEEKAPKTYKYLMERISQLDED